MQMFRPEDRSLVSVKVPSSNSLVDELNNLNSLSTQDNFQLVLKVLPAQLQLCTADLPFLRPVIARREQCSGQWTAAQPPPTWRHPPTTLANKLATPSNS